MKRHRVWILDDAEGDLLDLYYYVASRHSAQRADALFDALEALCASLAELPLRGHLTAELERVGVTRFREVLHESYRVIYEVVGKDVYVHGVLDGRRDMQSLLERRLLR